MRAGSSNLLIEFTIWLFVGTSDKMFQFWTQVAMRVYAQSARLWRQIACDSTTRLIWDALLAVFAELYKKLPCLSAIHRRTAMSNEAVQDNVIYRHGRLQAPPLSLLL
jgi:hypothetical protein